MYSLTDQSFGIVNPVVDHNSLLWLNDIIDQPGLAAFDSSSWSSTTGFYQASGNRDTTDSSDAWDFPLAASHSHWLPSSPSPQIVIPVDAIERTSSHPIAQESISPSLPFQEPAQMDSGSEEQRDRSRLNRRQPLSQSTRTPHRVVERRYRLNLNAQIELLASKLPKSTDGIGNPELYPKITSKATVMTNAINHIRTLEENRDKSDAFVRKLQGQIAGLQKLLLHNESSSVVRCF